MVFSSSIFVFIFMPIMLLTYFVVFSKSIEISWKNYILLFWSIIFYGWGGIKALLILILLVLINYILAVYMRKFPDSKRFFLGLAIGIDLLNLIYFKYYNFLTENFQRFFSMILDRDIIWNINTIALPIGISFFTFQIISYIIDVYREDVKVQKNPAKLMLYVMMFPQLVAGPIVRYKDVSGEIEYRVIKKTQVDQGTKRFILGFSKKVFLANSMGGIADVAFSSIGNLNSIYAWLGAICYSLQIYYDFSAYSDMAIGLGLILGFHFNENFNYPYISRSIKEFWRRWHISLSSWFRDYVYIPLGGNRKGKLRTYLTLLVVFLLTGIWHGAAWQFVFWGIYHGLFLVLERTNWGMILKKLPGWFQHLYVCMIVIIGWVFFRADTIKDALLYLKCMFVIDVSSFKNMELITKIDHIFIMCFLVSIIGIAPVFNTISKVKILKYELVTKSLYILLWTISVLYMIGLAYNPFIYFQF